MNTQPIIEPDTKGDELPEELKEWLKEAQPAQLFRINLKKLSPLVQLPVQTLLSAFLRLTAEGKFNLSWEYHCTHCNAVPDFKHHFGELKSEGYCALCDLGFRNTLDRNIEVTFTANATFASVPSEIVSAYREEMMQAVKERRYAMPDEFLSGLECLTNETFRELFGDEVLSAQESLAVETVTFLFTDIKGSTQMYSELGDAQSYEIVREHFKILFSAVENHGGNVVKTIGDAVMASFLRPVDALKAAAEAHARFAGRSWDKAGTLSIKMGLHMGSAIVVNLNDSVDYFGNTVNLAARVQASVDDHAVRFTRRVLDDPGANGWLREHRARLRHRQMTFKGITGSVDVYTYVPS